MSYKHKGTVMANGVVDTEKIITDKDELAVQSEDDGRQIKDYIRGDFEWWYFDRTKFFTIFH